MNIILSRTDNIGDVIFTLPMAGILKKFYPHCKIYFLGKTYTRSVVESCSFIDQFLDWDEIQKSNNVLKQFQELNVNIIIHVYPNKSIALLAKKAKIPVRIGTNRRFFHWNTCNILVNLTRKNSHLHESQLNLKLLKPLKIHGDISLNDIPNYYGFSKIAPCKNQFLTLIDKNKFNMVIHPKSKGSAREWSTANYVELCNLLPKEKFNLFVTGTNEDAKEIQEKIVSSCPHVKNVVGLFTLSEFISFLAQCDGLIACSTGPLHIASALGKHTIGLYPPIKNMVPTRWGALGRKAQNLVGKKDSLKIKNKLCSVSKCKITSCACINSLTAHEIAKIISLWNK